MLSASCLPSLGLSLPGTEVTSDPYAVYGIWRLSPQTEA